MNFLISVFVSCFVLFGSEFSPGFNFSGLDTVKLKEIVMANSNTVFYDSVKNTIAIDISPAISNKSLYNNIAMISAHATVQFTSKYSANFVPNRIGTGYIDIKIAFVDFNKNELFYMTYLPFFKYEHVPLETMPSFSVFKEFGRSDPFCSFPMMYSSSAGFSSESQTVVPIDIVKNDTREIKFELQGNDDQGYHYVDFGLSNYDSTLVKITQRDSLWTNFFGTIQTYKTYGNITVKFLEAKSCTLKFFCVGRLDTDTVYAQCFIKFNSKPVISNDTSTLTVTKNNYDTLKNFKFQVSDLDNDSLVTYLTGIKDPSGFSIPLNSINSIETYSSLGLYEVKIGVYDLKPTLNLSTFGNQLRPCDTSFYSLRILVNDTTVQDPTPIAKTNSASLNNITISSKMINYTLTKTSSVKCEIFILNGKMVKSFNSIKPRGQYTYNMKLSPGYYISRFYIDNKLQTNRFIIK